MCTRNDIPSDCKLFKVIFLAVYLCPEEIFLLLKAQFRASIVLIIIVASLARANIKIIFYSLFRFSEKHHADKTNKVFKKKIIIYSVYWRNTNEF